MVQQSVCCSLVDMMGCILCVRRKNNYRNALALVIYRVHEALCDSVVWLPLLPPHHFLHNCFTVSVMPGPWRFSFSSPASAMPVVASAPHRLTPAAVQCMKVTEGKVLTYPDRCASSTTLAHLHTAQHATPDICSLAIQCPQSCLSLACSDAGISKVDLCKKFGVGE